MKTRIERLSRGAALLALAMCGTASPAAAISEVNVLGGALTYRALAGVANRVRIAFANAAYTVDDPAETSVVLGAEALAAGCVAFDSNTVTCPAAAVTSLNVATFDLDDTIDVSKSAVPALVDGSYGSDVIVGTPLKDAFVWNPGSGNDTIDGGGGADALFFNGSNANENVTVVAAADGGFELFRDIANIHLVLASIEDLELATFGGTDVVRTVPLVATSQSIEDGDDGVVTDRVQIDAGGLCVTRQGDTFLTDARAKIELTRFTDVLVLNTFCLDDPCAAAAATGGCTVNGVRNQPCQGGDGDDVIVGTKSGDVIKAGRGNDRVRALDGDDVVCGEEGDDVLSGGSGNDRIFGGDGDDALKGDAGDDLLAGQRDADSLAGGGGNDEVDGGSGDDRVRGLGGDDVLRGGAGNDRIDGGPGLDTCTDVEVPPPFPRCEAP